MRSRRKEAGIGEPGREAVVAAVEREKAERSALLASAVDALAPVIALLRERRADGKAVDFRLEMPKSGSGPFVGILSCAELVTKPGSNPGRLGYDLVFQAGKVGLTWPRACDLDPDDDTCETDGVTFTPGELAKAIHAAEVRLELRESGTMDGFGL